MRKHTLVFSSVAGLVLLIAVLAYFFLPNLTGYYNFLYQRLNTRTYEVGEKTFQIINNSQQIKVEIEDEKKLEQVIRSYPELFERFNRIELTIEDKPQVINFGWGGDDAFGYSLLPLTNSTLHISMRINLDVIKRYNWAPSNVSAEIESVFINSLERSTINLDASKSDTTTETEEREKSELIESRTQTTLDELYRDNNSELFKIKLM